MLSNAIERNLFDVLLRNGGVDAPSVARRLHVGQPTVKAALGRLVKQRLIGRRKGEIRGKGRPAVHYQARLPQPLAVFDIAGTTICLTILDENLEVLSQENLSADQMNQQDGILLLCRKMLERQPVKIETLGGIGLVMDALELDGKYYSTVLEWMSDDFPALLEKELGLEVRYAPQAYHRAHFQKHMSQAQESPSVLTLFTLENGIACHSFIEGRYLGGRNGLAGELGHVTLVEGGRPCSCGKRGCIEAHVGGVAILQRLREERPEHPLFQGREGENLMRYPMAAFKEIEKYWLEGDNVIVHFMKGVFVDIAKAFAILTNLFDPDVTLCTGYLLKGRQDWLNEITKLAEEHTMFPHKRRNEVMLAEAEVTDSARVAAMHYFYSPYFNS